MKKEYYAIDIARFIAALLIIDLHAIGLNMYQSLISYMLLNAPLRLCVPLFFGTSFFLFWNKLLYTEGKGYLKSKIIGWVRLYLIWNCVYILVYLPDYIAGGVCNYSGMMEYLVHVIILGQRGILWYLYALMGGAILGYIIYLLGGKKLLLFVGALAWLFLSISDGWYGFFVQYKYVGSIIERYYEVFDTVRSPITYGLAFSMVGYILAEGKNEKFNIKNKLILGLFIVGALIEQTFCYSKLFPKEYGMFFISIPVTIFMLKWLMSIELQKKDIYIWFRNMASLIYYIHMAIMTIYNRETYLLLQENPLKKGIYCFLTVTMYTLVIAAIIVQVSKTQRGKILKKLYS